MVSVLAASVVDRRFEFTVGSKLVFVASPLSNCWLGIRKMSLSADCSVSELAAQGVGQYKVDIIIILFLAMI